MKFITQPPESNICGHCCLAMVMDKTLDEMIEAVGHSDPMNFRMFEEILDSEGLKFEMRFYEGDLGFYDKLPGRGIIRVAPAEDKYGLGHAIAFEDGKIYDPMNAIYDDAMQMALKYLMHQNEVWIIDWVMTISPKERSEQELNAEVGTDE